MSLRGLLLLRGDVRAKSEEEAVAQAAAHVQSVHGLTKIRDRVAANVPEA